jgi:membrane-associated phospholipid phosphatase
MAAARAQGVLVAGPRGAVAKARDALVRLVPAAILLWGALCGLGYLLTKPLQDSAFERWDGSVNRWFAAHRTSSWNTITHWVTYGSETVTVIVIGLLFFIGLRVRLGRWRESMFLAAALIGEVTIFVSITLLIDRKRPAVAHLDGAPPTSSFPSGHVAAAIALYGSLAIIAVRVSSRAWLRVLAVIAAVALPACVGVARLYRGMHFLTDVIGGAVLGVVWLTIVFVVVLGFQRRGSRTRWREDAWR